MTVALPAPFSTFLRCTSHSSVLFFGVSWPRYFHFVVPALCSKRALVMPAAKPCSTEKSSSAWCIDSTPSEPGITASHQKWHEKNQSLTSTVLWPWA